MENLISTSPLYQYEIHGHLKTIHDEDMYNGTTLKFEALNKAEFLDLRRFMTDFFEYKSLNKWWEIMQDMIETVFSEESFTEYHDDASQIFGYLDKLGEAMFLAYEIRGKAYMLEHYADRFGIKRKQLVDAEPSPTEQ